MSSEIGGSIGSHLRCGVGYNSTFVKGQLWWLAVTACLWIFRSLYWSAFLGVSLFQSFYKDLLEILAGHGLWGDCVVVSEQE